MTAFKNRFWNVRRLGDVNIDTDDLDDCYQQIKPYLNWHIMALEDNAILLCQLQPQRSRSNSESMIILKGNLMRAWLKSRKPAGYGRV